MERCVHKHFLTILMKINCLLPFSPVLFPAILPHTNYYIHITPSVKLSTLGKKCELSFAIFPKLLTEFGIMVYCTNSLVKIVLTKLLNGSQAIYQIGDSVLFSVELHQTGRLCMPGYHKALY